MKIVHIIIGLNIGGAELMLKRLVSAHIDNSNYRHIVVSLRDIGPIGRQLCDLGIEVETTGLHSFFHLPLVFFRLLKIIRWHQPDIIQTWMYHADLLGGLAAFFSGNRNIIWNIRCSGISQKVFSSTRMVVKICAKLSYKLPRKIICCAESAKSSHLYQGYTEDKMTVITNGYNLDDHKVGIDRDLTRSDLGLINDEILIGIVGRFDPLKDYNNFILSAIALLRRFDNVKFLMVGNGLDCENQELKRMIGDNYSLDKFLLIGETTDVNKYLAAMDIFCLSSSKEGFPNSVCEAMAMEIPCVVTNSGDAKEIVSDTGIVVPTKDHAALADALTIMINCDLEERLKLGRLARKRIKKQYSLNNIVRKYENLYTEVIKGN